jgi:hypothetical protein
MQTVKSVFGVTRALLPVLYLGGLAVYFMRVSGGSMEGIQVLGLGPTILGLGALGFLFCIPLILKVGKLFNRPPGSGRRPSKDDDDDGGGFDADAAIARYMASKRSEESAPSAPAPRPAPRPTSNGGGFQSGPKPTGFGRRIS